MVVWETLVVKTPPNDLPVLLPVPSFAPTGSPSATPPGCFASLFCFCELAAPEEIVFYPVDPELGHWREFENV